MNAPLGHVRPTRAVRAAVLTIMASLAPALLISCAGSGDGAAAPPANLNAPSAAASEGQVNFTFRRRFPAQRQFVFFRYDQGRLAYWGGPKAFTSDQPGSTPTWSGVLTPPEQARVLAAIHAAAEPPSTPRDDAQPEYQLTLAPPGSVFPPTYRSGPDPYYDALYGELFAIAAARRADMADAFVPPPKP